MIKNLYLDKSVNKKRNAIKITFSQKDTKLYVWQNMLSSSLLFAIGEKSNNKMYLLFPAFYYYCFLLIA